MFFKFPLKIPRWKSSTNEWDYQIFDNKQSFIDYMWKQFKLPGEYNLREDINLKIQEEGIKYTKTANPETFQGGRYHNYVKGSIHYKNWHTAQKEKVLCGVIYDDFYIPPYYHWYLNFCPFFDDIKMLYRFGDVWDTDLWYFHYLTLCLLLGKNVYGVKGRQKGFSLKHMAFLYWGYCWFGGGVYTVGAYDESLVDKSWIFLERYRNHINKYTPWKRGPIKPKSLEWEELIETKKGGTVGGGAKLSGVTFKQSPTKDVGGVQTIFNYEEPGVSPTITQTYSFIKPAMKKGSVKTGIFVACGSVGNLEQAEGLRQMVYNPASYDGLPVKNIWDEDAGPDDTCAIFISEAYSMLGEDYHFDDYGKVVGGSGRPFIDNAGNSDIKLSLEWIAENDKLLQVSKKSEEEKQIDRSQKCTSLKQAFAERKISYFPVAKLKRRQEQLKILESEGKLKHRKGLLYIDNDGVIKLDEKDKGEEHGYPINPAWEDKRGCVTIIHDCEPNPAKYRYFVGVDTVEADETTTSDSIQTVDVFEGQTTVKDEHGRILRIEGDRLVATYRGRFNPVDGGNEQAWLLIKKYNGYCYQERSKPNFQSYMKRNGWAEQYLAKESEVQIFKDVNFYKEKPDSGLYGFTITLNNQIWETFKKIGSEYLHSEYDRQTITTEEGDEKSIKIYTGIDRIEDYWLLEEFIQYAEDKSGRPKKNTDRLISFFAALILSKVFQNSHNSIRIEHSQKDVPKKVYSPKPVNMLGGVSKKTYNNTKGVRKRPISMI
jgi:hypothetical protein